MGTGNTGFQSQFRQPMGGRGGFGGSRGGPGGPGGPRGRGGRGGGMGRGGRGDPLMAKTVVITGGPYKGYIGIVKDINNLRARVELHTSAKIVDVDRTKIQIPGDTGPSNGGSGYDRRGGPGREGGSFNRFADGGMTPAYRARDGEMNQETGGHEQPQRTDSTLPQRTIPKIRFTTSLAPVNASPKADAPSTQTSPSVSSTTNTASSTPEKSSTNAPAKSTTTVRLRFVSSGSTSPKAAKVPSSTNGENSSEKDAGAVATPRKLYCICRTDGKDGRFMIHCSKCKEWYHGDCLPKAITEEEADAIAKFHCFKCEEKHGPSVAKKPTRKSKREKSVINYNELNSGTVRDEYKYSKVLAARIFPDDSFPRIKGEDLNLDFVRATGLRTPVVVENPEGLDMAMPPNTLTVSDVAELCGRDRKVEVLEVATQSERSMTLDEWAQYFEQPESSRKRLLNVISLEISNTPLGAQVRRPAVVRDLDWIDHVWPAELKKGKETEYPKVQVYCLMSVKDSYTDFHIDFGGSSVFYHLLSGEKIFYFVEPTLRNLRKYEKWSSSPDQPNLFFGDDVKECCKITLKPGNTMIIPTGWIHAVYTPKDSIVIGGNFLHGFNINGQLAVFEIEKRTLVPPKFRFPHYEKMQWYAAKKYLKMFKDPTSTFTLWELEGLDALVAHLWSEAVILTDIANCEKEQRKAVKRTVPEGIKNVQKLVRKLAMKIAAWRTKTALEATERSIKIKLVAKEGNGEAVKEEAGNATTETPDAKTIDQDAPLDSTGAAASTPFTSSSPSTSASLTAPKIKIKLTSNVQVVTHSSKNNNGSGSSRPALLPSQEEDPDSDDWNSDLTEMEYLDSSDSEYASGDGGDGGEDGEEVDMGEENGEESSDDEVDLAMVDDANDEDWDDVGGLKGGTKRDRQGRKKKSDRGKGRGSDAAAAEEAEGDQGAVDDHGEDGGSERAVKQQKTSQSERKISSASSTGQEAESLGSGAQPTDDRAGSPSGSPSSKSSSGAGAGAGVKKKPGVFSRKFSNTPPKMGNINTKRPKRGAKFNSLNHINGILPSLALTAGHVPRTECGVGALMPWANGLWLITYVSHKRDTGSGTGLYYIDETLQMKKHPQSVIGTYANRMIHKQTNQLIIGPHIIDTKGNVRTFNALVDVRLAATCEHIKDAAGWVYFLGMEGEFLEANVSTLEVRLVANLLKELSFEGQVRPHFKDAYSAFGKVVVCNNSYYGSDFARGYSDGRLAEWDGSKWTILERTQFNTVAGRKAGDLGSAIFAVGQDRASAILKVFLPETGWKTYRLPKGTHTQDHAWTTEWPRIREVESERWLMNASGLFYELPPMTYAGSVWGIRPVCTHLRIVPDFTSWNGFFVAGGNQTSPISDMNIYVGQPSAGLWFGKTDDLWSWGKPSGWGGVWWENDVQEGRPSDPFLLTGFDKKCLHVAHEGADEVKFSVEVDFMGIGVWRSSDPSTTKDLYPLRTISKESLDSSNTTSALYPTTPHTTMKLPTTTPLLTLFLAGLHHLSAVSASESTDSNISSSITDFPITLTHTLKYLSSAADNKFTVETIPHLTYNGELTQKSEKVLETALDDHDGDVFFTI
ncbi:hypothetical protein HK102_006116, partial [Quaeritorhiza haematococci]